jgi:hypothetical protein
MSGQLPVQAALTRKKQPAVADISMLFDNLGCRVKTNRLVLLRGKMVCVVGIVGNRECGVCGNVVFSVKVWGKVSLV